MKRILLPILSAWLATAVIAADPLPSWRDTAPKRAILAFVVHVTQPDSPDFVPVP